MLNGQLVLRKLNDLACVLTTAELALREPDEVVRIRLQREVPPDEVLVRLLRRPNDRPTLGFARVTATPLGRSRRARQESYDAKFAVVVMLQQRGTDVARGGAGAKYELAIETLQREVRRRNERDVEFVEKALRVATGRHSQ